jgi:LmbE family N-acetylglucosaminyl deacetylase
LKVPPFSTRLKAVTSMKTLLCLLVFFATSCAFASPAPRVLMAVAHPDDEYFFAATVYRITHRLNGVVDQMVFTDGRDGYHYSTLAEPFYGLKLTDPKVAAEKLPAIRKQELEQSGKILGIHQHFFMNHLDQKTRSYDETFKLWGGKEKVKSELKDQLTSGHYDFVLIQLPTDSNHEHHKAVALATLEVLKEMASDRRPVILASSARMEGETPEAIKQDDPEDSRNYTSDSKNEITRVSSERLSIDRNTPYGFKNSLSDQMVVNWMIAAHKSQGLFQKYSNHHRFEEFRIFNLNSEKAIEKARALFKSIQP